MKKSLQGCNDDCSASVTTKLRIFSRIHTVRSRFFVSLWDDIVASSVFTARRYASAVYTVVVSLSVCLAHSSIVSKRLNIVLRK